VFVGTHALLASYACGYTKTLLAGILNLLSGDTVENEFEFDIIEITRKVV
jgi:hypothetical protein